MPTQQELVENFRQDCVDRHMTAETGQRYSSAVWALIEFLNRRNLSHIEIDKHVLRDFMHYRRTEGGRNGRGVSQKTLENDFSALSCFYEYLAFEGHVGYNPILPVRKRYLVRYKKDKGEDSPRKLISVEEMSMLINSVLSTRDKALMALLAKTGVRRNELINMDVEDVNWTEQYVALKAKRFKKRSGRVVFFDDEFGRLLKEWLRVRESMQPPSNALFVGERGERLGRHGVYNLVLKYAEKAGLHNPDSDRPEDHFTPHCFRHWFTTHLRRAGMNREFIKELRGDRRRDAIDIYDHIDRQELRREYLAHIPQLGI